MKKILPIIILLSLLIISYAESQVVSWTHVVQSSEYTTAKTGDGQDYLVYTYHDERFNTNDWYDTWIEDWMEQSGGWSEFAPTMDKNLKLFLYDVVYNDGYVTWKAYTFDLDLIVGKTLKFYQLKAK
ncbi:hypothetical protein ES705_41040 [subsurface metagenome]|jgi:hypothetical protein